MRQIFFIESTEPIFKRACELREFGDCGDLRWREWYEWNKERTRFSLGELERAVAEHLNIPFPARDGFSVSEIDGNSLIITDLEEMGSVDLSDLDDEHMILPVTQFREWLYRWNSEPINRVMGTDEAAMLWGLSQTRVKHLCQQGRLQARLIGRTWILAKNQPNPKREIVDVD